MKPIKWTSINSAYWKNTVWHARGVNSVTDHAHFSKGRLQKGIWYSILVEGRVEDIDAAPQNQHLTTSVLLILIKITWKDYEYHHFTDEKTKFQKCK